MVLGVCYRTLGRIEEARKQFEIALTINANYMSSIFNLGLVEQQLMNWDSAIDRYRTVIAAAAINPNVISEQVRLDSKIRECDLLQAMSKLEESLHCWKEAVEMFPNSDVAINELGNVATQVTTKSIFLEI